MIFQKIKKKLSETMKDISDLDKSMSNYGKDDDYSIDAETARRNYEAYQNDLNERCRDFIKKWNKEIRLASTQGKKDILTNKFITDDDRNTIRLVLNDAECVCDFTINTTLQYFQQYFEDRGFKVVRIDYTHDNISWLKISW